MLPRAPGISRSNQHRFLICSTTSLYNSPAMNSMQFQSTYTAHSQRLQSDSHLESGRGSVVELFCRNSLRVQPVGCFRRGGPSFVFDGILRVTQENLELLLCPNSPDSHQTQIQEYKILD